MSQPPPGWQPDPSRSPESHSTEALVGPAGAATQFAAYDAPPSATGFNQFASASNPAFGADAQRTLTHRNQTTFTAMFVVGLYLVLAATTGIVLVGIFPAILAFRAFQRREPLAVLAVAAAAVAIVFSMTVLTRH
jgi:ABC-type sugar transport system permease subunit